jgi:hypothetical protein
LRNEKLCSFSCSAQFWFEIGKIAETTVYQGVVHLFTLTGVVLRLMPSHLEALRQFRQEIYDSFPYRRDSLLVLDDNDIGG